MRGIGEEAFLRLDGVVQALQQPVDGEHEGGDFLRHGEGVERAEVVGAALADARLQVREWPYAARERQPHEQQGEWQDDELRQHDALDDFGGEHAALVACFGHLHEGVAPGAGGYMQPRHAHGQAEEFGVAQARLGGLCAVWRRGRQALARNELPCVVEHLVIHEVAVVGAQQLAHGLRQGKAQRLAWGGFNELRQHLRVVGECAVKGARGQFLRHQPGERQ